jgi:DtxR family Mn-dependent transcriptional regulator
MTDAGTITPAMQDYLKTMLSLSESMDEIRVTDIASMLSLAKATVAQGIDHLKKHGLVIQEKYGPVELTATGKQVAREVRWRHGKLKQFLIDVLAVDPKIAEKDACLMEHVVSAHTMSRLMKYLETFEGAQALKDITSNVNTGISVQNRAETTQAKDAAEIKHVKTLNQLKIGEYGKVLRIASGGPLKKRLLDMGITTGAEIQVKGFAPMGDPLKIKIKGYNLSLRKEEASQIFIEMGA